MAAPAAREAMAGRGARGAREDQGSRPTVTIMPPDSGDTTARPARVETAERQALLDMGLKPSLTLDEWRLRGADSTLVLPDSLPACIFSVDLIGGSEFWFGFDNFYALLQYNRSRNYAMAIVELAREIAAERERLGTLPAAMPE